MAEHLTLRDVPGLRVGHWTDAIGLTGCTVVLAPDSALSRESTSEARHRARARPISSARPPSSSGSTRSALPVGGLGLAAADGVMRRLSERGIGFATGIRPVPIVPAAILFDLGVGDPLAVPDADAGYTATLAAERNDGPLEGRIGAGTGATVAKMAGPDHAKPGGVGSAARRLPDGSIIGALVVNNALGDIHARDGTAIVRAGGTPQAPAPGNTTLVVVGTDANLERAQCRKLAELGHERWRSGSARRTRSSTATSSSR